MLPSYHKAFEIELAAFYPFLYAWFEAIEIKQGGYIFPIRNWRNLNFRFYHCIYHSVYGTGLHKNNHNNKRAKMVLRIPCMQQFAIKMASWSQNQIMQPHFTYIGVIIKLLKSVGMGFDAIFVFINPPSHISIGKEAVSSF